MGKRVEYTEESVAAGLECLEQIELVATFESPKSTTTQFRMGRSRVSHLTLGICVAYGTTEKYGTEKHDTRLSTTRRGQVQAN